jgi:hypothetical protein
MKNAFWDRATRCNIPEDVRHCYRREYIPEDSVLRPHRRQMFGRRMSSGIESHGVTFQKMFVNVTAVNTSQKAAFFGPTEDRDVW